MSSFKTPEGVKSFRSNASIVYDTITTSDGEQSQCIKEVVVENEQGEEGFSLALKYTICHGCEPGDYKLFATNNYSRRVKVIYKYKEYGKVNGKVNGEKMDPKIATGEAIVSGQHENELIKSGNLADGVFELIDIIEVCFPDNDDPNNQNR